MDRLIPQLHLHFYASRNQALSYVSPTNSSVALLTLAVSTGTQLVNFVTEERFGLVDIDQRMLEWNTTIYRCREGMRAVISAQKWGKHAETPQKQKQ
jgi:hypothetical protein